MSQLPSEEKVMINNRQSIKSGESSVNVQGENVTITQNQGLTYSDVKDIAMTVFKSNFYDLGTAVEELVQKRAEQLFDEYLKRIVATNPELVNNTKNPDIRYSIYEAQKNYARRGGEELEGLLVEALVERTLIKGDIFKELVINEALEVVCKLTQKQIDILSLILLIKNYSYSDRDIARLEGFINSLEILKGDIDSNINGSVFQHLQYTSCISISIGAAEFEKCMYMKFPKECMQNEYLLKYKEIWEKTRMQNSSLTSVGIVIAIFNIRRKIGVNIDFEEWFKE